MFRWNGRRLGLIVATIASVWCRPALPADGPSFAVEVLVVDEEEKPVAGAMVRRMEDLNDDEFVRTDADGTCRLPLPAVLPFYYEKAMLWMPVTIHATESAGERQGFLPQARCQGGRAVPPLRVTLKNPRELIVRVIDPAGKAIIGADVGVRADWGHDIIHDRTNADGTLRVRLPIDAPVESVYAFKRDEGFDKWSGRVNPGSSEHRELPTEISLTLEGAETLDVRAIDTAGKPVAGVAIYPQLLLWTTPTTRSENFHNSRAADALTDAKGGVTFDWFPRGMSGLALKIRSDDYYLWGTGKLENEFRNGDRDLTAELVPLVNVSGRVTHASGKPAAGISLFAMGWDDVQIGQLMQVYHRTARTTADGTYVLRLPGRFTYAINVVDDEWGAVVRSGVVVEDGKGRDGVDFVLRPGTLLTGTITTVDREPFSNQDLQIDQVVGDVQGPRGGKAVVRWFSRIPDEKLNVAPPKRKYPLLTSRMITTDSAGRYQVRLGPGDYELKVRSNSGKPANVTIVDEPEIVRDLQLQ